MTDSDETEASDTAGTDGGDEDGTGDALVEPGETTVATDDPLRAFHDALQRLGRPVATASGVARALDATQADVDDALDGLADADAVRRLDVSTDPVVWFPTDWADLADRERVVPFPDRRQLVVDAPSQFTRARLSSFAHLEDTNRAGGYVYEIGEEDVWNAPHDEFDDLLGSLRAVLPAREPGLEDWIESQWRRARRFTLRTHPDDYVVLVADTPELMGNVARQKLDDDQLRAPISDTEAWVAEDAIASVKRTLYDAGYPVRDERDLAGGDPVDVDLRLQLRDYQRDWVDRFEDRGSGVLVGPPGSGKTVAALGVLASVGGETLILVPSRELAGQWREELLAHTTLGSDHVGEYHGGEKNLRPVTIATYRIAGMDRHRRLFDERRWGLIVFDEAHHVPAPVHRRSADLQSMHRLGLTATPVRESDDSAEIYTLIGPPVGTDWDALFDAGYVAEPTVELRYLPWVDEDHRREYGSTTGHERRQLAATNPAKLPAIRRLRERHADAKTLIFVEYIEQGEAIAEALSVPFVSGETRHATRERLLGEFRRGEQETLVLSRVGDEGLDLPDAAVAIVASGLGGSRRQGAQRAGRTMRPGGNATMYVLATQGTEEEEFVRQRSRYLAGKGVEVRETSVDRERLGLEAEDRIGP
ncbi:hypothetical protein BRD17_05015 [Halobacteriales archaeon SW_7_68_16]|nr:MAG: hypothetical protein BRD17_05015 [Halobacteriales archaeon SW_7_68_16]